MNIIRQSCVLLLSLLSVAVLADPLPLVVRGHQVSQQVFSLVASPAEAVVLGLASTDAEPLQQAGQANAYRRGDQWVIETPPQPGLYPLKLSDEQAAASTTLKLFVGRSAADISEGRLNGYRIGPQPPPHARYPALYLAPQRYIEVTPENIDTRVSENFTLRQFLCKQESGFPKYVALRESLLVLLEGLLQAVRDAGHPVSTFGVISGYRTPYYNRRIGNVANSRHVYGDAMDIYVDEDGDGAMDDLDGNGVLDRGDVDRLYYIVEEFLQRPGNGLLVGGVGRYYKAAHHGGFVHVDTRGYHARW